MAKETYRTSIDIDIRLKPFLDRLGHGERKLLINNLLDATQQAERRNPVALNAALTGDIMLIKKGTSDG